MTGPPAARYDTVADFYATGWPDSYDDSVSAALFAEVGSVDGLRALDIACGHGRMTRELARRGADVVGVDISAALIAKARAAEQERPLGIRYVQGDIASPVHSPLTDFDLVVCSFGLNDIDDPDAALDTISGALRPGGRFVASLLHPCFPGAGDVSGAWPPARRHYDEGWWLADGALSSLRRHRSGADREPRLPGTRYFSPCAARGASGRPAAGGTGPTMRRRQRRGAGARSPTALRARPGWRGTT